MANINLFRQVEFYSDSIPSASRLLSLSPLTDQLRVHHQRQLQYEQPALEVYHRYHHQQQQNWTSDYDEIYPSITINQHQQQQQQQYQEQQTLEVTTTLFIISLILSTIIFCTFIGNLFVIVAILVDKNLQTTANKLVLSLASADLMVACLVMPLGAYNDIRQGWYLGERLCEFWTSADVLCCTGKWY